MDKKNSCREGMNWWRYDLFNIRISVVMGLLHQTNAEKLLHFVKNKEYTIKLIHVCMIHFLKVLTSGSRRVFLLSKTNQRSPQMQLSREWITGVNIPTHL